MKIIIILLAGYLFQIFNSERISIQPNTNLICKKETRDSSVYWSINRKLTWNDFLSEPDLKSKYKAITTTTISTSDIKYSNSELIYEISCSFEKNKSWTKSRTNGLLAHEQLHFDIAEVATRKMRKSFLNHNSLNLDSINAMINTIMNEAILERRSLNQSYDKETAHGTISSKQKEWEIKVANELKSLEAYSSSIVSITSKKE